MAWRSYEKARQERGTLEPLVIEGEEFTFPAQPSGEFGMRFLELATKHGGKIPDDAALALIPDLIGEENARRLASVTTFPEMMAIVEDLLTEYGMVEPQEGDALPNRAARRKAGQRRSSSTSALSKQTSSASTG